MLGLWCKGCTLFLDVFQQVSAHKAASQLSKIDKVDHLQYTYELGESLRQIYEMR